MMTNEHPGASQLKLVLNNVCPTCQSGLQRHSFAYLASVPDGADVSATSNFLAAYNRHDWTELRKLGSSESCDDGYYDVRLLRCPDSRVSMLLCHDPGPAEEWSTISALVKNAKLSDQESVSICSSVSPDWHCFG